MGPSTNPHPARTNVVPGLWPRSQHVGSSECPERAKVAASPTVQALAARPQLLRAAQAQRAKVVPEAATASPRAARARQRASGGVGPSGRSGGSPVRIPGKSSAPARGAEAVELRESRRLTMRSEAPRVGAIPARERGHAWLEAVPGRIPWGDPRLGHASREGTSPEPSSPRGPVTSEEPKVSLCSTARHAGGTEENRRGEHRAPHVAAAPGTPTFAHSPIAAGTIALLGSREEAGERARLSCTTTATTTTTTSTTSTTTTTTR